MPSFVYNSYWRFHCILEVIYVTKKEYRSKNCPLDIPGSTILLLLIIFLQLNFFHFTYSSGTYLAICLLVRELQSLSCDSNILWAIQSNVLEKSRMAMYICSLASYDFIKSFTLINSWVSHEEPDLKPWFRD